MTYLFNTEGKHIANVVGEHLHAPRGQNVGHYLVHQGIFIDMTGRYLGEIVQGNRLMYKRSSPHRSSNFGNCGNHGNAGNHGNPGNHGSIGVMGGYQDVATNWL